LAGTALLRLSKWSTGETIIGDLIHNKIVSATPNLMFESARASTVMKPSWTGL
jgi:hypothetical protein